MQHFKFVNSWFHCHEQVIVSKRMGFAGICRISLLCQFWDQIRWKLASIAFFLTFYNMIIRLNGFPWSHLTDKVFCRIGFKKGFSAPLAFTLGNVILAICITFCSSISTTMGWNFYFINELDTLKLRNFLVFDISRS